VFDMMWQGRRHRVPVNTFAIPRMEPGKQRPIQSMEEARDWERVFVGEVKAGRDPSRPPARSAEVATDIRDAATFLDAHWERCVKPAGLRSLGSVKSRLSVLKQHLGHLPLGAREEPDEINRFKSDSDYAEDVELASMHRVLERLRAAMNWGMNADACLVRAVAVQPVGVRMNKKAETIRDGRLSRDEEKRLLDTALGVMNTVPHQYVGEMLHDPIIGALELCCRRGEMLLIQNSASTGTRVKSASRAPRRRTRRTAGFRSTRRDGLRRFSNGGRVWHPTHSSSAARTASTNRRFRRRGKR